VPHGSARLHELTKLAPVAILAEALGCHPTTIERHAVDSATVYARYVSAIRTDYLRLCHTETWLSLSAVNGVSFQSSNRDSNSKPASCAMRSHSDGQMYRKCPTP